MIPLYTQLELDQAKTRDNLSLRCERCQQPFFKMKKIVLEALKGDTGVTCQYCSSACRNQSRVAREVKCQECETSFPKSISASQKTEHDFCSQHCSATYHNRLRWPMNERRVKPDPSLRRSGINKGPVPKPVKLIACKKCGKDTPNNIYCSGRCRNQDLNRFIKGHRSKAERLLAQRLKETFPEWTIKENDREVLDGLELDVYIPEKKLAIEWNGIFHYEPIHGNDALERVVKKDAYKSIKCRELGIELIVIADQTSHISFIKSTIEDLIRQLESIR